MGQNGLSSGLQKVRVTAKYCGGFDVMKADVE
jgi:hypothetical protein